MPGHIISERNALDGYDLADVGHRLSITPAPDCARFSLRLAPDARAEQAGRCFGIALPALIGGLSASGDHMGICLGPDEWLLMAPAAEADEIMRRFAASLQDVHSLVDVSHREVGIEVRGPAAEWTLGAVCALDLASLPAPSATRTVFDETTVILLKHAPDHYRVEVWPSFAGHIWGLLDVVRNEVALGF